MKDIIISELFSRETLEAVREIYGADIRDQYLDQEPKHVLLALSKCVDVDLEHPELIGSIVRYYIDDVVYQLAEANLIDLK
jgi:hypothetical protein